MAEDQTLSLLFKLLEQQQRDSALLSAMSVRMEQVDELYGVVFRDGIRPCLITQISSMQTNLNFLTSWMNTTQSNISLLNIERTKGHWITLGAIITGLCGFISAIVLGIMKWGNIK